MAAFWSVMWIVSWVLIAVFAFLAGKSGKRIYLVFSILSVVLMYVSITLLGRY